MELNIGSNIIRNSNGVLNVDGEDQIFLEIGKIDNQLLLTADIYDSRGNHIAKLRRNAWAFNKDEKFKITTDPASLKLIEIKKETEQTIFEAKALGKDKIEVPQGRFYTHKGDLVEITPEFWRIKGATLSDNTIDARRGAVKIDARGRLTISYS